MLYICVSFFCLLGLVAGSAAAQAQPQSAARTNDLGSGALAQLPKVKPAPGGWQQPCLKSTAEMAATRKLNYESAGVESRWRADPRLGHALRLWGETYLGMPAQNYLCWDLPFVLRKLQEAAGDAPTGVVGERELDRLSGALSRGHQQVAKAAEAREQGLPTVFGISLGAPLRMPMCQAPAGNVLTRPKFVPVTCQMRFGRPDEPVPTATVYFAEPDHPTWLGRIGQSQLSYLANPSLLLDIRDSVVTTIRFETTTDANPVAVEALNAKFGGPPTVKDSSYDCFNIYTGMVYKCGGGSKSMQWSVKDLLVGAACANANFRCEYKIQLASEAAFQSQRRKQQDSEQRERALGSGRKL